MPTDRLALHPESALLFAEKVFRSMLPQCEAEFQRDLDVWHPELGGVYLFEYLSTNTYPRCWIVTAAIVFATAYTEYSQYLLQSLRTRPDIVCEEDDLVAQLCGPRLISLLGEAEWQWAICRTGSYLYRGGPRTLTRAFGVGLNFAFIQPEAAQALMRIVRTTEQRSYDWQVAAAGLVVRQHPISAQVVDVEGT